MAARSRFEMRMKRTGSRTREPGDRRSTSLHSAMRDGSYYCGTARFGLERRVAEHNSAYYGGYTATRRPVRLVYSQWFERLTDAVVAERQIKGWSRAKK